jgi:hypothetical protein
LSTFSFTFDEGNFALSNKRKPLSWVTFPGHSVDGMFGTRESVIPCINNSKFGQPKEDFGSSSSSSSISSPQRRRNFPHFFLHPIQENVEPWKSVEYIGLQLSMAGCPNKSMKIL